MPKGYLSRLEPKPTDFCLCGSGLAFRICCSGNYEPPDGGGKAIYKLLDTPGNEKVALQKARRFLTWYRLCHTAHTAPFAHKKVTAIQYLLETDIKALEEIAWLILRCLDANGAAPLFENVLSSLDGAIVDGRWDEAIFELRFHFVWRVRCDDAESWKMLSSSPYLATTTAAPLLMAWIALAPRKTPIEQRRKILSRLKRASSEAEIQMHCSIIEAAYRLLDSNDEDVGDNLESAIKSYRDAPEAEHSAFGESKLFEALCLLAGLKRDVALLDEAIAQGQRVLTQNRGEPEVRGRVLCECGHSALALRDIPRAITLLESSIAEYSDGLPIIYLASCHLARKDTAEARRQLALAFPLLRSEENRLDFAYVKAELALTTQLREDIEAAREILEKHPTPVKIFEDYRLHYLKLLAEPGVSTSPSQEEGFWFNLFTKYLNLKPSYLGIGVNVNAIIEAGVKNHSKKR